MTEPTITLNGTALAFAGSLADLLEHHCGERSPRGVAVALDGEVVPRATWESRSVAAPDRVEIVTAVQGG